MSNDILDALVDLHKQATTERSHYYVAKTAERAIAEIKHMRSVVRAIAPTGTPAAIAVRKLTTFEQAEAIYSEPLRS